MKARALALVVVALALGACQSHRTAMEIICNVSTGCPECSAADAAARATHVAEYLTANVTNDEAVQMFASIANVDPAARAGMLREAAAREGLTSCAWADELDAAAAAPSH